LYLSSQPSSDQDQKSFFDTINALNTLGFSQEDQDLMWKVLASILHLGNIEINDNIQKHPGDGDSCFISVRFHFLLYFLMCDLKIKIFINFFHLAE